VARVGGRSYIFGSNIEACYSSIARFAIAAHPSTILISRVVVPVGAATIAAVLLPILVEGGLLGPQLLAVPTRAGIKLLGLGFVRTGPGLGLTAA
jgi:hypothetical protein